MQPCAWFAGAICQRDICCLITSLKMHYSKYNFSLESREFWWINRTLIVRILVIILALLGQTVIERKITFLHSLSATLDVYKIQSSHPWKQMQSSKEAQMNYLPFYKFNQWNEIDTNILKKLITWRLPLNIAFHTLFRLNIWRILDLMINYRETEHYWEYKKHILISA